MYQISIADTGMKPNAGEDCLVAVQSAIAQIKARGGGRLIFPRGRYDFWQTSAPEHYLFVSNNDHGLQRIAFPLFGMQDIEILGEDAEFVFHGRVTPFAVQNCRNVKICGLTLDYERPGIAEAVVLDAKSQGEATSVTLRVAAPSCAFVRGQRLYFRDEDNRLAPIGNVLEWNPVSRETEFRVHDNYGVPDTHCVREIEPGVVELSARFRSEPTPGNVLAISHTGRSNPGIAIAGSEDVTIEDVTIHSSLGMAIIAQWTRNVRAQRVKVVPNEAKGRIISASADATHFVNCRGKVELLDCVFEGQMDDPTNIHGIYSRISRVFDAGTIDVELVHIEQYGVDVTFPGDKIEIVDKNTLLTVHSSAVTTVDKLNGQFVRVGLKDSVPETIQPGDSITSANWVADAHIRGCQTGRNRARGFLISTPGKVVIEDNHFHNPGAAILIAGDANYWFEAGAVRDITVRNNHFDNCLYGVWGRAVIDICPEIKPEHRPGNCYHKNIRIVDNVFTTFDQRLLKAHCVDGLTVRGNLLVASSRYPAQASEAPVFDVSDCQDVVVENNPGSDELAGRLCGVETQEVS